MIDAKRIRVTYRKLELATNLFYFCGKESIACKKKFEEDKLQGLVNGDIKGKNETMRQAAAIEAYTDEWNAWQEAEQAVELTRHSLNLIRIEVEQLRMEMRLLEVVSQSNETN